MSDTPDNRAEIIAQQNDAFRISFGRTSEVEGKVMQTQSVADLGPVAAALIANKVMTYDNFNADNDPEGAHDFGSFTIHIDDADIIIWWKIDLYDLNYQGGSEDPTNPDATRRVMTVLLPSDW